MDVHVHVRAHNARVRLEFVRRRRVFILCNMDADRRRSVSDGGKSTPPPGKKRMHAPKKFLPQRGK